jgi:hypothetical protein
MQRHRHHGVDGKIVPCEVLGREPSQRLGQRTEIGVLEPMDSGSKSTLQIANRPYPVDLKGVDAAEPAEFGAGRRPSAKRAEGRFDKIDALLAFAAKPSRRPTAGGAAGWKEEVAECLRGSVPAP